jgi:HSP20 family protein
MSLQQIVQSSLSSIESNMNNSFATQLSNFLQENINIENLWKPNIDMIETLEEIIIYIELPGVDKKSLNIDFFNNIINIKGVKKFPENIEKNAIRRQEIIYGNFERKIFLPINITNNESIKTTEITDGVLLIKIDRKNEEKNKFSIKIT